MGIGPGVPPKLHISRLQLAYQANSRLPLLLITMSTSSINNGSQANSAIEETAVVVPRVHFAEGTPEAGPSNNPDGDRRRRRTRHVGETRRGQRATRRFQRATSIEVEFSNEFTEARDTTDPYPSSQQLFERGRAPGEDDTFNDVFKKDFITVTAMKVRRKMRSMRIDPYPDAILRRGLHKKEPRENADPILEDAMMFTSVVGMELMEGLALTSDAVDRLVLDRSQKDAEVDGALVRLRHQLGQRDDRVAVIEEWKGDVTEHMRDVGEAQGLVRGRMTAVEFRIEQLQQLLLGQRRELSVMGTVLGQQTEVIEAQRRLIYGMEEEFNRKLRRLERMFGPEGRTMGNPIVIEDDPVADAVVAVD